MANVPIYCKNQITVDFLIRYLDSVWPWRVWQLSSTFQRDERVKNFEHRRFEPRDLIYLIVRKH